MCPKLTHMLVKGEENSLLFDMQENSHLFEAIKIIAASYLRADNGAIADSIQRYGLNDLLYGVARLELSLRPPLESGWHSAGMRPHQPGDSSSI